MLNWKMFKLILAIFTIGCLSFRLDNYAFAQKEKWPDSLFDYNHPFDITISYDFNAFNKTRDEKDFTPAKISYYLPDSTYIEKSIRIRPRGISRRDMCEHPPLKIDFSDSLYGVKHFNKWGKMKLVSMCYQAASYDQYIIKEYLIYKAYERLTDVSFRTYLVNVTFIDTGSKKSYKSPGFFLEDIDHLAKRMGGKEVETNGLKPTALDTATFDLMALFQYMIGNTDWYVPALHNLKLISIANKKWPKPVPVPYDFDYSGVVNASYAVPHEGLPIESVRDRYFMGICRAEKYYMPIVKLFREKKDEIYDVFNNCNRLTPSNKKDVSNYLDSFYKIIENDKIVGKYIYGTCN